MNECECVPKYNLTYKVRQWDGVGQWGIVCHPWPRRWEPPLPEMGKWQEEQTSWKKMKGSVTGMLNLPIGEPSRMLRDTESGCFSVVCNRTALAQMYF